MSEDMIRYDILAQEALRGVIRKVLEEVARSGLPGEHHFFITFQTGHPGVRLSRRMQERYPEEMTIVIQHLFWGLDVGDTGFEIDLSFDDIRERLRVPYAAIRGFFDPSVKFGLQFDTPPLEKAEDDATPEPVATPGSGKGAIAIKRGAGAVPTVKPGASAAKSASARTNPKSTGSESKENADGQKAGKASEKGADVVSLDTFRKKK